MKIVLYGVNNYILALFEDVKNPSVDNEGVSWDGGKIISEANNFVILSDDTDLSNGLTNEIISTDQKDTFKTQLSETDDVEILRQRLSAAEDAILMLMNLI